MAQKPSIPKGTRDFSPAEMSKRNYMFDIIKKAFRTYGYQPLETPAMENLSTLLGKYGEEGDKLLFKILNSGDFTSGLTPDDRAAIAACDNSGISTNALASRLCEKGLRYDLTVPLARYVVQHFSELTVPFRRYQIQPVWRADRPQKGRYREFYQCDADIIGTRSLLCETELVSLVEEVFGQLGINVVLKINNRKILYGIAETIGYADRIIDITIAIDKLDKTTLENVEAELMSKGIDSTAIEKLRPILQLHGSNSEKITALKEILKTSETGLLGVAETEQLFSYIAAAGTTLDIELDLSLARGLNYYTGAIFEVKAKDFQIGSICGGGRYDNLTGIFGLSGMSGVGISFGADRIYDVMEGLGLFPAETAISTEVMFANFGGNEESVSLGLLQRLRKARISSELYPDPAKMKKQLDYASRRGIPFVVLIGDSESAARTATIRDMSTGSQESVPFDELPKYFSERRRKTE